MGEIKARSLLEINRKGLLEEVRLKQKTKCDKESARGRVGGRNTPGGGSEVR